MEFVELLCKSHISLEVVLLDWVSSLLWWSLAHGLRPRAFDHITPEKIFRTAAQPQVLYCLNSSSCNRAGHFFPHQMKSKERESVCPFSNSFHGWLPRQLCVKRHLAHQVRNEVRVMASSVYLICQEILLRSFFISLTFIDITKQLSKVSHISFVIWFFSVSS